MDISYNARIEQYSIPPHLDQTNLFGCGEGLGSIRYDFNRVWKLETVKNNIMYNTYKHFFSPGAVHTELSGPALFYWRRSGSVAGVVCAHSWRISDTFIQYFEKMTVFKIQLDRGSIR